jgi:hypothetical protein
MLSGSDRSRAGFNFVDEVLHRGLDIRLARYTSALAPRTLVARVAIDLQRSCARPELAARQDVWRSAAMRTRSKNVNGRNSSGHDAYSQSWSEAGE